jgi:hypothetical protein
MDYLRDLPVETKGDLPVIPVDGRAAEVRAIKAGGDNTSYVCAHAHRFGWHPTPSFTLYCGPWFGPHETMANRAVRRTPERQPLRFRQREPHWPGGQVLPLTSARSVEASAPAIALADNGSLMVSGFFAQPNC